MDINLSLISEDYLNIPISNKNEQIINKLNLEEKDIEIKNEKIGKIIKEEIKNNCLFLNKITNDELFNIKIEKNNNDNNKEYENIIEVKCKDKLKEEIEKKINSCIEKENILFKKQEELKKLSESMTIDEKLFEKKIISLLEINREEYEKIIDKIVELILNYENFIKEVNQVQKFLIKYRDSSIIALCFKICVKKFDKVMEYVTDKYVIFLNNEKLIRMFNSISFKINNNIIDELYENIFQKLCDKEIFKNHKEEYEEKINFYKEVCYLFPIIKFFENRQDKEIYKLEEDLNLEHSENIFDEILRVNNQIPKRNGLNITLDYFKKHTNIEEAYDMSLRRILLIYQKYKILVPSFKLSSFLYE